MGYKYPSPKTSRLADLSARQAGGRPAGRPPTVINMTVGASGRPPGRSHIYREQWLSVRSTARSTDPVAWPDVHGDVHVSRPVLEYGRPARLTARTWQPIFWVRKTC